MSGAKWTPEEVARQLSNRPNHPHYIATLVRKAVKHETATLLAEHEALLKRVADAPTGVLEYDAYPWLSISAAGLPSKMEGQLVRILAEPGEEGS